MHWVSDNKSNLNQQPIQISIDCNLNCGRCLLRSIGTRLNIFYVLNELQIPKNRLSSIRGMGWGEGMTVGGRKRADTDCEIESE